MFPAPAKRILIAPLDWGLGHTTRCIPVIRRLLAHKGEVIFAGDDRQQTFIAGLFPQISLRPLPGYGVTYSRGALMPALLRQLPGLVSKIRREHEWLARLAAEERIDGIISDNRYGLWHPHIPSVIITHQAQIKTGAGRYADGLLRAIHYRFLERFPTCWIPDVAGPGNLGGTLSHPAKLPANTRYIGWLSQLEPPQLPVPEEYLLVLLSGPEPQRTILSDMLWPQVLAMKRQAVFVEGSAAAIRSNVPRHVRHYAQVAGPVLQALLEGASVVVCRSGYSTLMDLALLRKRALLIPTPGQTEQEYLARSLAERGLCYAAPQKDFALAPALDAAQRSAFQLSRVAGAHTQYEAVLDAWLEER